MKYFWRNIYRMSIRNKFSLMGAIMIISLSIAFFVALLNTSRSMDANNKLLLEASQISDVYAYLSGIPVTDAEQLEEIEGIDFVSGRLTEDIRVKLEDPNKNLLLYVNAYNPEARLDRFVLSGTAPGANDIYLGTRVMDTYNYKIGDTITLMYNGMTRDFTLRGTAQTPTCMDLFLPGAFLNDPEGYDLGLVNENTLSDITNKPGLYTMLSIKLLPGYSFKDVESALRDRLNNYGLYSLAAAEDEASIKSVSDMITSISAISYLIPIILLSVAIFMLYAILKKFVSAERILIGTMKAFGLNDMELISGYLIQGLVIGVVGALIAGIVSYPGGIFLYQILGDYYCFPVNEYHHYPSAVLIALVASSLTGVFASYIGVKEILQITPSQAMRSPAPPSGGKKINLPEPVMKKVGLLGKMAVQAVTRNPVNGIMIVLAVVISVSVGSGTLMCIGMLDDLIVNNFEYNQDYDYRFTLNEKKTSAEVVNAVSEMDMVEKCDTSFCTNVVAFFGGSTYETQIMVTDPDNESIIIHDTENNLYHLTDNGIILNKKTASALGASVGDTIDVLFPGLYSDPVAITVDSIVKQSMNDAAYSYISYDCIEEITGTPTGTNTVYVTADSGMKTAFRKYINDGGNIARITDLFHEKELFVDNMDSYWSVSYAIIFMAFVAGGIMVYHLSMINLRERMMELGTMLILGRTENSLKFMIVFEDFLYMLAGIILSIPATYGILQMETMVFAEVGLNGNPTWQMGYYLLGVLFCTLMMAVTYLSQQKYVSNITLTDILKERG